MPGFSGLDRSAFPGQQEMDWLRANTNLVWCGYYLAPAPSHSATSWMGKRQMLRSSGWGIVPIYVGQHVNGPGSKQNSPDQGRLDGQDSVNLMRQGGVAPTPAGFFHLQKGPPLHYVQRG